MDAETERMLKGWRGRRLLACQAADLMEKVIEALGEDDGSSPPPEGGLPVVDPVVRDELRNTVSNLLRLTLALNDRRISPQRLRRF